MSYASVTYAPITVPGFPCFDVFRGRGMQRVIRRALVLAVFAVQSVAVAGVLWLILAGPGFVTDRNATTAPAHVAVRG